MIIGNPKNLTELKAEHYMYAMDRKYFKMLCLCKERNQLVDFWFIWFFITPPSQCSTQWLPDQLMPLRERTKWITHFIPDHTQDTKTLKSSIDKTDRGLNWSMNHTLGDWKHQNQYRTLWEVWKHKTWITTWTKTNIKTTLKACV